MMFGDSLPTFIPAARSCIKLEPSFYGLHRSPSANL